MKPRLRPVRGLSGWMWMVWTYPPRKVGYGYSPAEAYAEWEAA